MTDVLFFVGVGFLAQMIDGALGMAYGVTSTTFLLSRGILPAQASAAVHASEMVTTLVSGISHLALRNVDMQLFKRLVIPGVIGAAVGAYVLSSLPGDRIRPFVSAYLLIMGLLILRKAARGNIQPQRVTTRIRRLGLAGGFFDAIGGGGWGPIVTSTLVARGNEPRYTIGSVNTAEFFVTVSACVVFFMTVGFGYWRIIISLIIGAVIAAPIAAFVCRRINARLLMTLVGILISLLSLRTILQSVM
ncbi:MAG: sulfite exporter TauE/SafE family protein [Acidobacteria bacterium]|nr:sulfite exporter TauE/SafE family protein [Acidobacteriota bacterium]